jgi:hypothetical protein
MRCPPAVRIVEKSRSCTTGHAGDGPWKDEGKPDEWLRANYFVRTHSLLVVDH